ncbi:MAG: hypothetical protein K0Q59_269 [Paenibacillus sp.]|nr:hypothetical protein [Paenibacillus sp.]
MKLNQGDECYFELALQTVLHNNKHRLSTINDDNVSDLLLRELTREVMQRAQTFKMITDMTVAELESGVGVAFKEGVQ